MDLKKCPLLHCSFVQMSSVENKSTRTGYYVDLFRAVFCCLLGFVFGDDEKSELI